jgi:tetratricopeptide (TPR) repeat protein
MSMSADAAYSSCCASCGIAEVVVPCDDCDLVRYCGDECQNNHKLQHEEACKKRATELREELLFKQPESSHHGDCPICSLPLPLDKSKGTIYHCCCKVICKGCDITNQMRQFEQRLAISCPFCRKPAPETKEEGDKLVMKRIEANDPVALWQEGGLQYKKGEYSKAFEYFTKAAKLGDADAHFKLAELYHFGRGVEKDKEKYIYHLEEAAIGGHPLARYDLGVYESNNGNIERAVKHWIIAARQGDDDSLKELMEAFKEGYVEKDILAVALRAHHAAVDETKSPQRKAAEEFHRRKREGYYERD